MEIISLETIPIAQHDISFDEALLSSYLVHWVLVNRRIIVVLKATQIEFDGEFQFRLATQF